MMPTTNELKLTCVECHEEIIGQSYQFGGRSVACEKCVSATRRRESGSRVDVEASKEGSQMICIEQMFNKLSGADVKTQKEQTQ
jgi:hypothetical protein